MNASTAIAQIGHYKLLQAKLKSLEVDLKEADSYDKEITKETEELEAKIKENAADFEQKKAETEKMFTEKLDEYRKQVKYFEAQLAKRIEERDSQLAYLSELNICEVSHRDLVNFDWPTLKKLAGNGDKNDLREKQYEKAIETAKIAEVVRDKIKALFVILNSTEDIRCKVVNSILSVKEQIEQYKEVATAQQKTITGHEQENYRLTLIIKQCIAHNEPMSEFVTKNVRDKCHSFIKSENDDELIYGLKKYKKRQDNKATILKMKVIKLSQELSSIQVASDQTADLIQHYLTMIHTNSNRLLAEDPYRPLQLV